MADGHTPHFPNAPHLPSTPHPSAGKPRVLLWVVIGIVTAVLGGLLLIVAAGFLFVFTAQEQPVTAKDREVVLDIEELAEWIDDYEVEQGGETITKVRYFDHSYDVDYEYDIPDDPDAPYLNCTITVERNRSDARTSFYSLWGGTKLGMSMFGEAEVEVEESDLFTWGDESRFATLKSGGEPFGNLFIARKGNHIFYLLVSGVYFDDEESFADLVDDELNQMMTYKP